VPSYTFKIDCCWSEVPGGSLLTTGGGESPEREVVRIDTRKKFTVAHCAPMLTKNSHAAEIILHISTSREQLQQLLE
jgi:hypothetical protein